MKTRLNVIILGMILLITVCGCSKRPAPPLAAPVSAQPTAASTATTQPRETAAVNATDPLLATPAVRTPAPAETPKATPAPTAKPTAKPTARPTAVPVHEHSFSKVNEVAPTCTAQGYSEYRCSCGKTEQRDVKNASGHQYGSWKTIQEPTSSAQGTKERVCAVCGGKETASIPVKPASGGGQNAQQAVLNLVNARRAEQGLPALKYAYDQQAAADTRAKEIITKWGHTRPNGQPGMTALTCWYSYAGENLAQGYATAEAAVDAWMHSKDGHRENILSPDYQEIVIGHDAAAKTWVQLFLTR